jgi:hypothetical protein
MSSIESLELDLNELKELKSKANRQNVIKYLDELIQK